MLRAVGVVVAGQVIVRHDGRHPIVRSGITAILLVGRQTLGPSMWYGGEARARAAKVSNVLGLSGFAFENDLVARMPLLTGIVSVQLRRPLSC
jgi:hypothetical protein